MLLLVACPSVSAAAEVVRAELGKDTAWTGEAVPLIVTLYSPGPFSGTASFELPELPKTTFVRAGNPLVGSEQIDDESYFTQRHEFTIYTQRSGAIVIPAFLVRFAGKKSFTSAAEPMEGSTQELRFQSTRPPGTEHLGLIVAARNMEVSQTWQPATIGPVQAGDVIARTISRRAVGTTAMMFPPIPIETPAGVRYYATDPIVQDFTERGASGAERSETIKYQFERAGTFQLPDLAVTWWDPDAGELKRQLLPGRLIDVQNEAVVADTTAPTPRSPWQAVIWSLTIGMAAWLVRKPAEQTTGRPENAARRSRDGCGQAVVDGVPNQRGRRSLRRVAAMETDRRRELGRGEPGRVAAARQCRRIRASLARIVAARLRHRSWRFGLAWSASGRGFRTGATQAGPGSSHKMRGRHAARAEPDWFPRQRGTRTLTDGETK